MGKAKDRAQEIANKMREAHRVARAAESQAHALAAEFTKMLPLVAAEADIERNAVEYQPGRYECNACHQPMLFTTAQRKLPPCDNCGQEAGYQGPPPRVLNTAPVTKTRFPPGLYECKRCLARTALLAGSNSLPPCEFCAATDYRPV